MEDSKIQWCEHTFNPWVGCTKVSHGCTNCYAESLNIRYGKDVWGSGKPRERTSIANWRKPLAWDKAAAASGARPRVFCASMADWLDPEVPIEWLADLLALIASTPNLDWLQLTKRPENWRPRLELALAWIDNAASTGYAVDHESAPAERERGLQAGRVRGTGDRRGRADLDAGEASWGQVARRIASDSVRAAEGGDCEPAGVRASSRVAGRQEALGFGASAGVETRQRPDSAGRDGQPSERRQDGQPTREPGACDVLGAAASRDSGTRRETLGLPGCEPSEDVTDGRGRSQDEGTSGGGRDGEGHRGRVRHEAKGGVGNLQPSHMAARRLISDWLGGNAPANVWLGASVEDQRRADERIPALLSIPAHVRFLSMEPLLGAVDLTASGCLGEFRTERCSGCVWVSEYEYDCSGHDVGGIDWIIVGGGSGAGARQCSVEWIRDIVRQCRESQVPVFVKQLGARPVQHVEAWGAFDGCGDERSVPLRDPKGGDPDEWPQDLRVREFPR